MSRSATRRSVAGRSLLDAPGVDTLDDTGQTAGDKETTNMATTAKGERLALDLYKLGGGKPWDTDGLCSLIARHAARYTRLSEEACSGPRWSWDYAGDWTSVISVDEWQLQNTADLARFGRLIARAVAELPPTEYGPVEVELGGDPRGYTVRLLVPTAPGEVTEVGIDEDGSRIGSRRSRLAPVAAVYTVTRHGETVATADTEDRAWITLAGLIGYSVHHAMTFEGWDIVTPDGTSLATTYAGVDA